jgi:hypothetical protein
MGAFNFSNERVDSIVRLKEYFLDEPMNAIKKLVDEARIVLEYPFSYDKEGRKIMDYLRLVGLEHLREIELDYDTSEKKLKPSLIG